MEIDAQHFIVKQAETCEEKRAAQRLRYTVFVEEMGARAAAADHSERRERDGFDGDFDHLLLIDTRHDNLDESVVGVYRLLRGDVAIKSRGFYSEAEFDLQKLLGSGLSLLELGRSCVAASYRGGVALHLLWQGLADYVLTYQIDILFGVASFPGRQPQKMAQGLSHLHHNHLAPEALRVRAQPETYVPMDILPGHEVNKIQALSQLPPLMKAYLRLGGFVGDGAYVDQDFNTTDVFMLMETKNMSQKRRRLYSRDKQK